ncbi:MAG: hypothetical protein HN816_16805 [Gammaproteobacteria bacterium]|nr:hypothetical protein [Gammaproteobacteria bacterium]
MPTECHVEFEVRPYQVLCDGKVVDEVEDSRQLLPRTELAIYNFFLETHRHLTVMHAALLQHGEQTLLLAGPSGSGKSSLSMAAVSAGWQYRTDELSVTDGKRLWGIPRAIQFDATCIGDTQPGFLETTDSESYRFRHPVYGAMYQPLVTVSAPKGQIELPRLEEVSTIILRSGRKETLEPLDGINALKHLHRACFLLPQHDLGALVGDAWRLDWSDTGAAIRLIQQLSTEVSCR